VKAARDLIADKIEIDEANPFPRTPQGEAQHYAALDDATDRIVGDSIDEAVLPPKLPMTTEERLALFDQPAGEGQQRQIEQLTHDLRGVAERPVGAQPVSRVDASPAAPANFEQLARAVMHQESRGDPNAVSPKGARGKMQVMPGTQRDPGFGVRAAADDSEAERVRVGRDYLGAMVNRYDGNQALALAAYNAGPGRVDGWLKSIGDPRTGGISDAEWASRIPIAETRNYVPGVLKRTGAPEPRMVALAEEVIDGESLPVVRPLDEVLAEHDADDAFISAIESCLA